MPDTTHEDLATYLDGVRGRGQKGFWGAADAYMVSLLKEYWGDAATAENDYCFDYLPRINGDHGTYRTVMTWSTAERSSATSSLDKSRGRLGARPAATPAAWRTSTGWSCAISP